MTARNCIRTVLLIVAAGCCQVASPTVQLPATKPAGPVVVHVTRSTIEPGDWVRIAVPAADPAQPPAVSYGRVSRAGSVMGPTAGRVRIAGMTPAAAAAACGGNATVSIVCYQLPGDPLPRPIQPFDLVRIDICSLVAAGVDETDVCRVTAEGLISLPMIPPTKVAGLEEDAVETLIADRYASGIHAPQVTVTTLEQAPVETDHLDMPDGPAYPVPELLKPLFDAHNPLSSDPGPAASALIAATAVVPTDRSGPSLLTRFSDHPGTIRPGDWLRNDDRSLQPAPDSPDVYVRVTANGEIRPPLLSAIHVAGLTAAAASEEIRTAYDDQKIVRFAPIAVRSIYLQQPGTPMPRPIQPFDLVRVDVTGLEKANTTTTAIHRVAADGTFPITNAGRVHFAGADDVAAAAAVVARCSTSSATAQVVVVTLEQAPADAARLSLPDGPVQPVPEALRPAFQR